MRAASIQFTTATLLTVLATAATAACAGAAREQPQMGPEPASASADASTAELEVLYRARMESDRIRFTEADVDFMTGMISHHAQALVMAALAPTHDASPTMRILTARVINAQKDEIATMQGWLRDRDRPVPEVELAETSFVLHGVGEPVMHMPGMLTLEQMRNLDEASGIEFDRLFLTYMIQHHRGAVDMVHDLFGTDGAAQGTLMFKLASDIQADQDTEIRRMELMLEALADAGGYR